MIVVWAILAVIGLVGTWWANLQSIAAGEDYLGGWFASWSSTSASIDLIVLAVAASILFVVEGRRVGMRHAWVLIPLTFAVAAAFTVPLFLALRERRLRRLAAGALPAGGA